MARENFDRCMVALLKHEGGKVDHPKDPGGRTNMGVTQRVYDAYRARLNQRKQDVYLISNDEVRAIYRQQYWDKIKGDDLPAGVDYVVFDGAVNSGPVQSVKWLQRAINKRNVNVDGAVGAVTLSEVAKINDHDKLIADICVRRMAFLQELKTWPTFGKGWTTRVNDVRKTGQAWARGSVGPQISTAAVAEGGNARALISDAVVAPGTGAADVSTGAGLGLGGISVVLEQARDSLLPMSAGSEWIGRLVAMLVVASALLTVGGLVLRYFRNRQAVARADNLDIPGAEVAQ